MNSMTRFMVAKASRIAAGGSSDAAAFARFVAPQRSRA
jgi:hypothetical protein